MTKILRKIPVYRGILQRLGDLVRDRRGIGAVEFALIAPLLLGLYITAFELTIGLSISKRATRSASSVADLVTQQTAVTPTYLATMKDVAASIFAPYTPQNLTMKITGVTVDSAGTPTVAWSWDQSSGKPYKVGDPVNVPTDMRTASTFLVHAEVSVTYKLFMFMPGIMPDSLQNLTLSRDFYYRQRVGNSITCTGC